MDAIDTVRRTMLLFFMGLPMIMIGLIIFLAMSLLNTGMIVLALGHIIVVPIVTMIIHIISGFLPFANIKSTDVSMLVPSIDDAYGQQYTNVMPSYWVAHIVFFCTFIFSNALSVYERALPSTKDYDWKLQHRLIRSRMVMGVTVFILLALLVARIYVTRAETIPGMLVGLLAFIPLGYYWYQQALKVGATNSDVLGILQQMAVEPADDGATSLCVPTGA
jgi:hypothetical protein